MEPEVPHISKISASTISYCYDELVKACERGDVDEVRKRIPWTIPTMNQSYPLSMAALFGHVECVKELMGVSNVERYGGRAMAYACSKGQADCVEILVPFVQDNDFDRCFCLAAKYNYCSVIEILLQHNTNPLHIARAMPSAAREGHTTALSLLALHLREHNIVQDMLCEALQSAIKHNHIDCVRIVLPLVDATLNNSFALQECFNQEQVDEDIFQLLFPVSDAKAALQAYIQRYPWDQDKIQWLEQRIECETLRLAVAEYSTHMRSERKI